MEESTMELGRHIHRWTRFEKAINWVIDHLSRYMDYRESRPGYWAEDDQQ